MLLPHLKPSNQRHLPYSSAYSASKRAVAPVPPYPSCPIPDPADEPTSVLAHFLVLHVVDLLDFVIEALVVIIPSRRLHRRGALLLALRLCAPLAPPCLRLVKFMNNPQQLELPLPKPRTNHSTQTRSLRSRSRIDWAVEAARRVRGELVVAGLQVDGLRGGAGAPTDAGGERPTC